MDFSELRRKLIEAARGTPADDRTPYGFEKRIMARLGGRAMPDPLAVWGQALTRAAIFSVALMLVLAAGSFLLPKKSSDPLAHDLEKTLIAAADNDFDMTGEAP